MAKCKANTSERGSVSRSIPLPTVIALGTAVLLATETCPKPKYCCGPQSHSPPQIVHRRLHPRIGRYLRSIIWPLLVNVIR